jgi:tetratricopeptide (TPR) repeat protein
MLDRLGEYEQARSQFERARELYVQQLGPEHPETLRSMNNLANSYANLSRQTEVLKLYGAVLESQQRVLPMDHPDTLTSMNHLAITYAEMNRQDEALKLLEEVLKIRQRVLPKDHLDTLSSMNNLALCYANLSRLADALKLYEAVLETQQRILPKDHPELLLSMVNLALSLCQADRWGEAIGLIDEFLKKADQPGVDPGLWPTAIELRWMHFRQAGDAAECRATAERWEQMHPTDAASLYNAACYRAVVAELQTKTPGDESVQLAQADAERAMEWLRQAIEAGWTDAAHLRQDTDLDGLRERQDFQELLAELESAQSKSNP